MSGGDILSIIPAFFGAGGVLVLTYYGSRWYVKRMATVQQGNHIKVVERLAVSKTGSILIIDVQGIQYMISVSDQNIQVMKELEEPISFKKKPEITKESFLSILKTITHKEKENEDT